MRWRALGLHWRVLTGMARRLDHAVEGHELEDNQLPQSDLPKVSGC
jgi:hypothetical protein